jgi:hypothetical protein
MYAAFGLNELIYEIAAHIRDFRTLGRFTRVSRRIGAVIDERRADIYAKHTVLLFRPKKSIELANRVYGCLHSVDDAPALVSTSGVSGWYRNGKKHRDNDQPAEIWPEVSLQRWYHRGRQHRDGDRPAVVWDDGSQRWYQHGRRHRDNDQPAMILANGTRCWYQRGQRHRDGGLPAVISPNGDKEWYQHDQCVLCISFV